MSTEENLLVQQNPLPAALSNRLADQLSFIIEVDRLKTVFRASPLAAAQRRENDAEHSWHLALMVMLLSDYADDRIDVGHTMRLVIIHDLVEIYAGDTPLYDTAAAADQAEREEAAAGRLFRLLPVDQADWVRSLWDEFEAARTPEARFAKAIDRLQPILLNWMAKGGTWQWPGVTADVVRARTAGIKDGSRQLWDAVHSMIEDGVRSGWIRPPA